VRLLPLLAAIPIVVGAAMLVAARVMRRREPELRRSGTAAIGTIVDNQVQTGPDGQSVYLPVVHFTTETGRKVRAVGDTPGRRAFLTDRPIAVVYDPRRPKDITVGPGRSRVYAVGGATFLFIGAVLTALVLWLANA
jgi:hypothetical protein